MIIIYKQESIKNKPVKNYVKKMYKCDESEDIV